MLGTIEFDMAGQPHVAWLENDYTWRSDDEQLSRLLNDMSSDGPATEQLGDDAVQHLLYRVAYRVGGRVKPRRSHGRDA